MQTTTELAAIIALRQEETRAAERIREQERSRMQAQTAAVLAEQEAIIGRLRDLRQQERAAARSEVKDVVAQGIATISAFAEESDDDCDLTADPEVREAVPVEMPAPSVAERLAQYVNHDRAVAPSVAQDASATTVTDRETLLARARALIDGGASKSATAKALGIPRTTLNDWLSADGAEVPSTSNNGALPVS